MKKRMSAALALATLLSLGSALHAQAPAPTQRPIRLGFGGGFRDLSNSFLSGLQYNFDYTNYRHKEIERADGIDEVGTIFDNKTFSYRSLFEQAKHGKLSGRFGFEGFNRDYEVNGAEQTIQGTVKHNAFSAFALEELDFDRVKFQFGGRVENNRYRPENVDLRDRSFTGFSGGAGVNVGLWTGGTFVANYTRSFRAPALEELYNNGPHIGTITFEGPRTDRTLTMRTFDAAGTLLWEHSVAARDLRYGE